MAANLTMVRIATKLDDLFNEKIFNGGTNSFSLTNNVWIARVVDSFLAQNESSATGRKRLVLVHGNRFLLHMILSEMKQYANYSSAALRMLFMAPIHVI